jgi:hypothetical protein
VLHGELRQEPLHSPRVELSTALPWTNFMAALYWAADDDLQGAKRLLSLLVHFGGICRTLPGGITPQPFIDRLLARGIVDRVRVRHANGSPPRYVLMPRYAAVQRTLIEAMLAIRHNGLGSASPQDQPHAACVA